MAGPRTLGAADRQAAPFVLKDVNGKKFDLEAHLKKDVVLLNFFATWCAPCMAELPILQTLHEEYGDKGLQIVVVSVDDAKSVAKVKPVVREQRLTFPVVLDTQTRVVSLYNPKKIVPFTAIIDRNGMVVSEHRGYKPGDEAALIEELKGLLDLDPAKDESGPGAENIPAPAATDAP